MSTIAPPRMSPPIRQVKTTELAGLGSRLMAAVIDSAAVVAIYLVGLLMDAPTLLILGVVGIGIYQMYLLTTLGQTIGKKVLNIRIVKIDTGENGGFMTNVGMRLVLNGLLGFIPLYALVDVLFIFRADRRCIHDMIAGTRVIEG